MSILTFAPRAWGRLLAAAALALGLAAGAAAQTRDRVIVASKIDTEGALLGHMIALVLERAGVPVESRVQLGPTKVVRTALVAGSASKRMATAGATK